MPEVKAPKTLGTRMFFLGRTNSGGLQVEALQTTRKKHHIKRIDVGLHDVCPCVLTSLNVIFGNFQPEKSGRYPTVSTTGTDKVEINFYIYIYDFIQLHFRMI